MKSPSSLILDMKEDQLSEAGRGEESKTIQSL